jgi:predicted lipoprotein with Yx(FWY)xxD motif
LLIATLALASGCGSSGKSTTSGASASPATTSTASGGYRGYGGSSAPATTTATTPAATTPATPAPAGAAESIAAKSSKLGTILAAGAKQMTVYLFEADKGSVSACSGECAAIWPPVTVASAATAGAGAMSADLGTITRSDGTKQVTYKGHPLYFYAKDGDKGDAYGQGLKSFGASWYVLAPSGVKVDHS